MSPPKAVIPCAAEIKDLGHCDPCLVVPESLPLEFLPLHKRVVVGGQLRSLGRSMFTLSPYIMDESFRFQGFWNGQPMPMLVSIGGSYKYLVNQKSFFFKCGDYVGSDIDPLSPMEPDTLGLKLRRYQQGSDLTEDLTIVVAEY